MNQSFLLSVLFVLSICMAGCQSNEVMESKNIAQSEIHQAYTVTYDETDDMVTVNAEFRAAGPNGTTLVLSEPSDVTCNGTEMKLDTYLLGGAYYSYEKHDPNGYDSQADFEFIDLDKKHYRNTVDIFGTAIVGINSTYDVYGINDSTYLYKNRPNHISLKVHPLKDGENQTFTLNIQGDSTSVEIEYSKTGNATIPAEKLAGFYPSEKVTLQFVRSRSGKLPQATERGGTYTVITYSKKVEAIIQ